MKDLLLWRLLDDPDADRGTLAALLNELADQPERERLPFLNRVLTRCRDADPRVRAAAATVLRGATGRPTVRALVALLSDAVGEVRASALEALRHGAGTDPGVWAHAVFHRDPRVRRAALEGTEPGPNTVPALWLLADAECRERARALLEHQPLDAGALVSLVEAGQRGWVDREMLCERAGRILEKHLARGLFDIYRNDMVAEALTSGITTAEACAAGAGIAGLLPSLLDLAWELEDARLTWALLVQANLHHQPSPTPRHPGAMSSVEAGRKLAAALIVKAAQTGRLPGWAGHLLGKLRPAMIAIEWLPVAARRAAAAAVLAEPSGAWSVPAPTALALLKTDAARDADGRPVLAVAGMLAVLTSKTPIQWLAQALGADELVRAVVADPVVAAPLLRIRDGSVRGRAWLLDRLMPHGADNVPLAVALMTELPADALGYLARLDGAGVRAVLAHFAGRPILQLAHKTINAAAQFLAGRLQEGSDIAGWLDEWLAVPAPEEVPLAQRVLAELSRMGRVPHLVCYVAERPVERVRQLLTVVDRCAGFPHEADREVARALAGHADPVVRAWADGKLGVTRDAGTAPPPPGLVALTPEQARRIGACKDADLAQALEPALAGPCTGVARALAARTPPCSSVAACVAVIGSHDPLAAVDAQLTRFGDAGPAFTDLVASEVARRFASRKPASESVRALLANWDVHGRSLAADAMGDAALLARYLATTRALKWTPLAQAFWHAARNAFGGWRWRDREGLAARVDAAVLEQLTAALPGPCELSAAAMLGMAFAAGLGERMGTAKLAVSAVLPDVSPAARAHLAEWIDARGLVASAPVARPRAERAPANVARKIAECRDLDTLEDFCRGTDHAAATEASLRLVEIGAAGCIRLAWLLEIDPPLSMAAVLAESVGLWPDGDALDKMRALAALESTDPQLRFTLAVVLAERGEDAFVAHAMAAACAPRDAGWLRAEDTRRLVRASDPSTVAAGLAVSPHPYAYVWAVNWLIADPGADGDVAKALRAFLECGTRRLAALREEAAWRLLLRFDDPAGAPILLGQWIGARPPDHRVIKMIRGADLEMTRILLAAGAGIDLQQRLLEAVSSEAAVETLATESTFPVVRRDALVELLSGAKNAGPRRAALGEKARLVAEAFAWVVLRGRELARRVFRVEMLHEEGQLGWTVPGEPVLHVNPLPILRGERQGRAIVEGLGLHETGHQLYHAGDEARRVQDEARREGLDGLLNLVADEHLERKLAARAGEFRERFRALGAWAFMKSRRDEALRGLLESLGMSALDVLAAAGFDVARRHGHIRVGGALLRELERGGSSFARFFRALRLGLGGRHGDPKVNAALKLFGRGFRESSMRGLLEIARQLRDIFGLDVELMRAFRPHRATEGDPTDIEIESGGLTQKDVDREVERILRPPRAQGGPGGRGRSRLAINVGESEPVNRIRRVQRLAHDPAAAAELARRVARPARVFRRFLADLGRHAERVGHMLRGRRVDRPGLVRAVLRRDPRVLEARRERVLTDLFLGIVVDCSGSMQGASMERAQLFAALLADAGRGVPGVDVRLFGFTESVIYDAGDARRPAAHALFAGGGNDDAAALLHVAEEALASRRRAKLLVMISDGLPTSCSVATLRALVARLTRKHHVVCAQVAVRTLEEICFPHHVVVDDADTDACVRRFGGIVARLVRQEMNARRT